MSMHFLNLAFSLLALLFAIENIQTFTMYTFWPSSNLWALKYVCGSWRLTISWLSFLHQDMFNESCSLWLHFKYRANAEYLHSMYLVFSVTFLIAVNASARNADSDIVHHFYVHICKGSHPANLGGDCCPCSPSSLLAHTDSQVLPTSITAPLTFISINQSENSIRG